MTMVMKRMAPKMEDIREIVAETLEYIKEDGYQEWECEVQAAIVEVVAIEEQVQVECSRVAKEVTTVEIGEEWRGEVEAAVLKGIGVTKVEEWECEVQAAMVEVVAIEEQVQVECSRVVKEETTVEIGEEWRGEVKVAALKDIGVTKVEAMVKKWEQEEEVAKIQEMATGEQVHGNGVTQKGTDLDNKDKTGDTEGNLQFQVKSYFPTFMLLRFVLFHIYENASLSSQMFVINSCLKMFSLFYFSRFHLFHYHTILFFFIAINCTKKVFILLLLC